MPTRPPLSLGVRRRLRRAVLPTLVAVTAAVAGVGVSVQPAHAHNTSDPLFWYPTYNDGRQCTVVRAAQNHGRSVADVSTMSTTFSQWAHGGTDCYSYGHPQHPYRIWQKGYLFKDGRLCIEGGWQPNLTNSHFVDWWSHENYENICGTHRGVVTHDLYQQVWNPYANRWNSSRAQAHGVPWTTMHNYNFGPHTGPY